jgi:hypothetical protein
MRAFLSRLIGVVIVLVLAALAAPYAAQGSTPLPPVREGCMSQWMFNGIWRVRVTKVDPLNDDAGKQTGWLVTEQWRNGTDRRLTPATVNGQVLVLANGAQITPADSTVATLSAQDLGFHDFLPSAQYTHLQKFIPSGAFDPANKPAAIVISFDAARQAIDKKQPQYSVNPPNYKIKLDCTATAQQQAQGGSFELPAKAGCLNQWLANGLWKVRVTQVGAEMDNGTHVGWLVTQEWTNISGIKLQPANSWVEDEQLVLANGDTVSSGNEGMTTGKWRDLFSRDFTPGSSYTHTQNFRYDRPAFDPSNKPTKLLVVFDVGAYKYFNGKPFPGNPPNFRISFSCGK